MDSNLDWGQALEPLGTELKRLGGPPDPGSGPPAYLSYFGIADPESYGIRYRGVGVNLNHRAGSWRANAAARQANGAGCLASHPPKASRLHG